MTLNPLDNIKKISKTDSSNMIGSINLLPKQITQTWEEMNQWKIPTSYQKVNKVIINGMGGSGLGAHIVQSVFFNQLKIPLGKIHSYSLPGTVDNKTLYIISSYSGSTEEPLATIKSALAKKAKIFAISTGSKLGQMIRSNQIHGYLFDPKYNPCKQPRIAIGYSVTAIFKILEKCNLIKINQQQIKKIINNLETQKTKLWLQNSFKSNLAKQAATKIKNKIAIVIAAEFLSGNAHTMANQINENSKNFSSYFIISELNHHLMEGLKYPKSNPKNLHFIFFNSSLYHPKNKLRIKITQDILKQNHINFDEINLIQTTKLEQSFEMLQLGSYISFYASILNGLDPSPIPWVDYFKKQLSK